MTALPSKRTQRQTELWGEFINAWNNMKSGFVVLATIYRACVDEGMDMSPETLDEHDIPPNVTRTLAKVADRKLLPEVGYRLLRAPETVMNVLAGLPSETQKKIAEEGVVVWRDDAPKIVTIEKIRAPEARRLIDRVSGRLLTPEEQAARAAPRPVPVDQRVEILLTREQYNDVAPRARRAGQSVSAYLLGELVKAGAIDGRKKK